MIELNAAEELYIVCMNFAANAGPGADIRDYGLTPDLLTRARAALDAAPTAPGVLSLFLRTYYDGTRHGFTESWVEAMEAVAADARRVLRAEEPTS